MITRIFRARVPFEQQEAFESTFDNILEAIKSYPGMVSASIGLPTRAAPEEYAVISVWASAKYLEAFAGPEWEKAVLPAGMDRYATDCWVHHYKVYSPPPPQPPLPDPDIAL